MTTKPVTATSELGGRQMKGTAFYLGIALLFTHELDAMPNHEWRVLPLLRELSESVGESVFIAAHVPIFAIVIACVASLNPRTRLIARDIACAFLVLHGVLHRLFSGHPAYDFSTPLSAVLIYGAAACGLAYFVARFADRNQDALR